MSTTSSRVRQGRILLEMAMRNLVASRVRTLVVGGIVALGVVVVVLGSSLLDSIDLGMTRSIQDSLGGHVQLYNADSRDPLALYGGTMGESVLEPIVDFAGLKAAALSVPGVKQVVPMGIDQAMVSMGNVFDVALEKLRADVRRRLTQGIPAEDPEYEAHKAHLRRMATLLQMELRQAREIADETSGVYKDRKADFDALEQAVQGGFWDDFDRDPLASLEFLENRVAPLSLDGGFTFIRYVGTDPEAFQKAFPGSRVVEGSRDPPGPAGRAAREALRRGVAEAPRRAAPRQDQGGPRPQRSPDRQGRGAATMGEGEHRPDPRHPPPARPGAHPRGGAAAPGRARDARSPTRPGWCRRSSTPTTPTSTRATGSSTPSSPRSCSSTR